jgi:hypothetical protein
LLVLPLGKYQTEDVVLRHGATDQPDAPCSNCVTATPPPASETIWDTHDPDDGAGSVGITCPRPETRTAVVAELPPSVTWVTVPLTACGVVFVSRTDPGATPEATDWPVQYHAEDSALGALTSALGSGSAPAPCGVEPRVATTTETAAMTTSTTERTGQRGPVR